MRTRSLKVILCMNGILVFSMGCRSKAAVVANAQLSLSLCLPGYLFENDSRVVPEKFEGEPSGNQLPPPHAHNRGEALAGSYREGNPRRAQSPAIPTAERRSYIDVRDPRVLRSLAIGFGFSPHTHTHT